MLGRPGPLLGLALLGLFAFAALFGPWLAPQDPLAQNLDNILAPPGGAHWLGTDENGSDLLSLFLHGCRLSGYIALTVLAISFVVGVGLGTLAGYVGGWVDEVIMRVVDVLLAFPGILLNLAVAAMVKEPSQDHLIFALCLNGWVGFARVARGQVLSARERDFVQAARCLGASGARIIGSHVLPTILPPLVVQATFTFAAVLLAEASLSFLGLGPQQPWSWGSLLSQGTTFIWLTHHLALVPGVAIALLVLACNLLGDGLQDLLDPRRRRSLG
ncbi:MAG: ABC transporter permease [Polyangia bacterium]|jgi:peptide/nickel transport system permease protein|nr:ABC transporter permease [Polyangia bacterium]